MKRRPFGAAALCVLLLTTVVSGCAQQSAAGKAKDYVQERAELAESNAYKTTVELTEKEKLVDARLQNLKAEYLESCKDNVPYDMPVMTDENIWNSKLYQFCKELPKGADLHVHGLALLPAAEFMDYVESRPDLYIVTEGDQKYTLVYHAQGETPAEGEMLLKDALSEGVLTREELNTNWTLLGAGEENIWVWFEKLFARHQCLGSYPELVQSYYEDAFRYYSQNNTEYLEVRVLLFGSHEDAVANAEAIREAYYKVRDEDPAFRVSIVGCGLKSVALDPALTDTLMDNAQYVHEQVKDTYDEKNTRDFLIGVDLVNEEDQRTPLEQYAPMLKKIKADHPDLHIILHAGESLFADSDNVIDAYLIGAERIGHGLNLYRFPDIEEAVEEDDICLEVCPISNQILRYVADLRLHPATEYLKRGVPFALCSDDPAYEEHTTLADDYFAAIVCWDLGLAEVKQVCMNAIDYSLTDEATKKEMKENWEQSWDTFLEAWL